MKLHISISTATNKQLEKILKKLKSSKFEDLPSEYRSALLQRWNEHEDVKGTEPEVLKLTVLWGRITKDEMLDLLRSYTFYKEDFSTLEEWLDWRLRENTDHGQSEWPCILWKYWEEPIEDGWHRLISYIKKGRQTIPVVYCPKA